MAAAASPTEPTPKCPKCGADASGKFCSSCGASMSAGRCASCGATLSPGARYCHRCGTPVGSTVLAGLEQRSFSSSLPWAVAGIALVALIALVAGQRFSRPAPGPAGADPGAAPFASAGTPAPDISNLSPAEAASRLYDRVMGQHERGRADSVQIFAPMAIMAYQALGQLDLDQHYDVGRIAAVSGDETIARAEADTILAKSPNHLLGLILAGNAARMRKDTAAERAYHDKLVAAAPSERNKQLPEYTAHANDITIALETRLP
jgi:Double zinc ribbon